MWRSCLAPASSWFGDTELEAISVPTMIIGGTSDTTTPIETENVRPFDLISDQVFRADLDGAVHFSFSNSCDLIQGMRDKGHFCWRLQGLSVAESRHCYSDREIEIAIDANRRLLDRYESMFDYPALETWHFDVLDIWIY